MRTATRAPSGRQRWCLLLPVRCAFCWQRRFGDGSSRCSLRKSTLVISRRVSNWNILCHGLLLCGFHRLDALLLRNSICSCGCFITKRFLDIPLIQSFPDVVNVTIKIVIHAYETGCMFANSIGHLGIDSIVLLVHGGHFLGHGLNDAHDLANFPLAFSLSFVAAASFGFKLFGVLA